MSMEATEQLLVKYSYMQGTETLSHLADLIFSIFTLFQQIIYIGVLFDLCTSNHLSYC